LDVKLSNRALALLATCFIVAYLWPFHAHPFGGFMSDWLAILGIAFIFAFHLAEPSMSTQLPKIIFIPLGIALVIAVQTMLGMLWVPWDAVLPILYLCVAVLAMMIGAGKAEMEGGAARLCYALAGAHLLVGLISVVIATIQFLHAEALFGVLVIPMSHSANAAIRPFANIAQPNQLALLLCVSIAAVWWLYQVSRIPARLATGLVFPLMWGLVLTQSRIGWLIAPAFAALIIYWQRKTSFKVVPFWLLSTLLFVYGVLVIALPAISTLLGVVTISAVERVGSSSVRLALIQQAWQISLSHPWFGVGWYQFGPQQLMLGATFPENIYSEHTHNIVMNFAVELGWPITIILFGVLAFWFYDVCLRRSISKETGFATLFFIAAFIHSLVEYPLWYAYVLMPLALLMGMAHQQHYGSPKLILSRMHVATLVLMMTLGLVWTAIDFRNVHLGFRALGLELIKLKPIEGSTTKPSFTLFPHFYDFFRFAKTKESEGMSQEEIAFMEQVARRFGYDSVLIRMAAIYALNDRPEDALRTMLALHEMYRDAYKTEYYTWQYFASVRPDKFAAVFSKMPSPLLK
jgi:hypothetical protein